MELFRHQSGSTLFREAEINPGREVFYTVATDAKFDEIESHAAGLAKTNTSFKHDA